jgi:hypothetical protein
MGNFSNVDCSNILTLVYLDASNVHDDTIYVTYDNIESISFNKLFGAAVCGKKDDTVENRAIFYLFGGNDSSGSVSNELIKIVVDIVGGGPIVVSDETIDCTSKPDGRYFSYVKIIGNYIYMYGGLDVDGNPLSDI